LFEQLMLGHPLHSDPRQHQEMLEHYYEVQVVWDESMAARSATWLRARQPGRKLIILAGTAHCTWSGIPQRLEDRTGLRVVNLLPVHGGKPIPLGAVQDMDQQIAQGYEFQMVFEQ
jgi:uncharacterized iron-regulated protein